VRYILLDRSYLRTVFRVDAIAVSYLGDEQFVGPMVGLHRRVFGMGSKRALLAVAASRSNYCRTGILRHPIAQDLIAKKRWFQNAHQEHRFPKLTQEIEEAENRGNIYIEDARVSRNLVGTFSRASEGFNRSSI